MKPNQTYDLIIIGGGVVGLMGAYFASRKGKNVLLLEAESGIKHASIRNFGSLVPSGQQMGLFRELGERSLHWYRQFSREFNLPIDESGTYFTANDSQDAALLEEKFSLDSDQGYSPQLLSQKELRARQSKIHQNVLMGLYYANEISLDSQEFLTGFIDVLSNISNITVQFNSPVMQVEPSREAYSVITGSQQVFKGLQVLCCTGHFAPEFVKPLLLDEPVRVCKLQMMRTKPLKQRIKGNLLTGLSARRYAGFSPCPSFIKTVITKEEAHLQRYGIHLLFKQHANGEITIGDSHQYYPIDSIREGDFFVDTKINEIMLNYANKVVNIESNEITKIWLGWYLDHADGMLTKTCRDGFHCVTALAGKGMTIGPALMEKVIEQIVFCNRLTIDIH